MVEIKMWEIGSNGHPATEDDVDVYCPECRRDRNIRWPSLATDVDYNEDRTVFDMVRAIECTGCEFSCRAAVWFR